MINDEVVSLSSSYTVVICARTIKTLGLFIPLQAQSESRILLGACSFSFLHYSINTSSSTDMAGKKVSLLSIFQIIASH